MNAPYSEPAADSETVIYDVRHKGIYDATRKIDNGH